MSAFVKFPIPRHGVAHTCLSTQSHLWLRRLQRVVARLAHELKETQQLHQHEIAQIQPLRLWDLEAPDYEKLKHDYGRLRQTSLHQIVADLESELAHQPSPTMARCDSISSSLSPEKHGVANRAQERPSVVGLLVQRHVRDAAQRARTQSEGVPSVPDAGWEEDSPRTPLAEIRRRAYGETPGSSVASSISRFTTATEADGDPETPAWLRSAERTLASTPDTWGHGPASTPVATPAARDLATLVAAAAAATPAAPVEEEEEEDGWERAASAMRQLDAAELFAAGARDSILTSQRELEKERGEASRLREARMEGLETEAKLRNQVEAAKAEARRAAAAVGAGHEGEIEALRGELRVARMREAELNTHLETRHNTGGDTTTGSAHSELARQLAVAKEELAATAAREAEAVGSAQRAEARAADVEAAAQAAQAPAQLAEAAGRGSEAEIAALRMELEQERATGKVHDEN